MDKPLYWYSFTVTYTAVCGPGYLYSIYTFYGIHYVINSYLLVTHLS